MVSDVLLTTDETSRKKHWADILTVLHEQAVFLPISYLVNVAIYDEIRYKNFAFGAQQYDVPVYRMIDSEKLELESAALASAGGANAAAKSGHGGGVGGSGLSAGAVAGIVVSLAVVAAVAVAAVVVLVAREKKGNPIFTPLLSDTDHQGCGGLSTNTEGSQRMAVAKGSTNASGSFKDMAVEFTEQRV
jgi:hypothetical protein